jgi:rhamnose transport system permease protein
VKQLFAWIALSPITVPVVLLIGALAAGAAMSPNFLDAAYLLDKASLYMPIAFVALAMTFVIIAGQIDLSVASGTVLVSVVAALAFERLGLSMPLVMAITILAGGLLGLFNGLLVTMLKLPSLVVTLGTLALFRGLSQVLIGDGAVRGFPAWFVGIDFIRIGDIVPVMLLIFLAAAGILAMVLNCSTFGRGVFAVGTNEAAARYSGIRVDRIKLAVFVMSGLAMGIGALVLMSQIRTVDHMQLRGGELVVITAVVLGGTSIFGGRGSITGTVLALMLLVAVRSAMGVANVRAENQLAVVGSLLIASVLLTDITGRLRWRWRPKAVSGGTVHA